MMNIFIGVFIGIIMGSIGIISIKLLLENNNLKEHRKETDKYIIPIFSLIYSLLDNNIVKKGSPYLPDIRGKCIYVLINYKLKQYRYKNDTENEFLEINSIDIPKNMINVLRDYFVWDRACKLNSIHPQYFSRDRQIRKKSKKIFLCNKEGTI